MNAVKFLLETNISTLPFEDKCAIKKLGRPVPALSIVQKQNVKGKEYTRSFNANVYDRNNWICGCDFNNRFYCFPCLIFAKGSDSSWTKTGVCELSHLSQKIKKHEQSMSHLNACLDLSVLGKIEIREQLNEAFRRNVERQNDQVRKNRYVLSRIIDCIKFCGEFELALRGHDETTSSKNPGIFRGLINFTSALDNVLNEHLNSASVFKGTSKEIQNDLLDCMLQVSKERILEEIRAADFVSIIVDETTDVSTKFQMVVVLRYVLSNGKPTERFWTFLTPENHDAHTLTNSLKNILSKIITDKEKLISQSYDGASVMSGRHSGVQALIRQEYPYAYFVHCYAHQLNLIMAQAASQNREVRIFFANLTEISSFFSHSTQRTEMLNKIVGRRLPSCSGTRWNFNVRAVLTIYENKDSLIECFEELEETSKQTMTINQAQGLRLKMQQPNFNFWLEFFYKLMPHIDIFYNMLQKRNINPMSIKTAIESFINEITKIREEIDFIQVEETENLKRRRKDLSVTRNVAAKEICDLIENQAKDRFEFCGHLVAANLFEGGNFPNYKKLFPEETLNTTVAMYPFINKSKLKTELQIIYNRNDFENVKKATDFLSFLLENNLEDCFGEVTKLLKLLLTVPMTTAEAERCFSSLKRIKTFLRSTMDEERLNALAILSIEKEMISKMEDFNERVIDKFASKKERRMDFTYKLSAAVAKGNKET